MNKLDEDLKAETIYNSMKKAQDRIEQNKPKKHYCVINPVMIKAMNKKLGYNVIGKKLKDVLPQEYWFGMSGDMLEMEIIESELMPEK